MRFAVIGETGQHRAVAILTISLPTQLEAFVNEQVRQRGYASCSDYVGELIRRDRDCQRLRGLLLAGAASVPTAAVDDQYFDALREQVGQHRRGDTSP